MPAEGTSRRTRPRRAAPPARQPRIALALAGGGPLGAIYEIGALCALERALRGLDLRHLDHYVGVSAGAFLVAALANGMSAQALHSAFIQDHPADTARFDPAWLMAPAYGEFAQRGMRLPGLLADAAWRMATGRASWMQSLESLGAALPTGLFSSEAVHHHLERFFAEAGFTNDFRQLTAQLTLVATDLDSGESAPFGSAGWEHVPITRAVQASAALPGLFPPVEVDGRMYVDGALKKTLHASVALEQGVDLLLCLNPLVPFHAPAHAYATGTGEASRAGRRVADGGLPAVMGQTFRSLIHSRVELGMRQYTHSYPHTDILLLEPARDDAVLQQANTFGYAQRGALAEHAFLQTMGWLRQRADTLGPMLQRHGITLDTDLLHDPQARLSLAPAPSASPPRLAQALGQLGAALDRLAPLAGARVPQRSAPH